MEASIARARMDQEQCLDIRRSVFCGLMHLEAETVFDSLDEDSIHCLATVGHKPVGSGRLCPRDGEWWLEHLAVLPPFRLRGLARAMVHCLAAEAGRRQIAQVKVAIRPIFEPFLRKMNFQQGVIVLPLDKK